VNIVEVGGQVWNAREQVRRFKALLAHKKGTPEDDAILRSYQALSRGRRVLELVATMRAAGCYAADDRVPQNRLRPRFAIARADKQWCWFDYDGARPRFVSEEHAHWSHRTRGMKHVSKTLPAHTFAAHEQLSRDQTEKLAARALLPAIPLVLRPAAARLREYLVLWEATWEEAPPRDPLLLAPLGGTLYAVVAQWDLSPLERAAMMGRLV
jgi:hypothetical protein